MRNLLCKPLTSVRATSVCHSIALGLLALLLAMPVLAIQAPQSAQQRSRLLQVPQAMAGLDVKPDVQANQTLVSMATANTPASRFLASYGGDWQVRTDRRSGYPNLIQGAGIPLYAGRGNTLARTTKPRSMAGIGQLAQRFVRTNQDLLGVAGIDLRLDEAGSTPYGDGSTHWFVQLAQYVNGVRVKGANVFVRISNGNVVQFGNQRVVPVKINTVPKLDKRAGIKAMMGRLQFMPDTHIKRLLNSGELLLVPRGADRKPAGLRFNGAAGSGYEHVLAWHYTFRVNDDPTTYDVLVDAQYGQVLSVDNLTVNAQAQVSGNVYTTDHLNTQSVGMPFASVSNAGNKSTDLDGKYDYSGGTASVALDGEYFKIVDNCGAISLSNNTDGNLDLGANTGTDCTTPGIGGGGNTNASRSAFYNLTLINRKASTFFPSNSWLLSKVTAEVNENDTCNAFWDGSTLNFFKSAPGSCANTGEIPGVFLHEWGHGMDTNAGGSAPNDYGSGEAVGDTFAMLETKESCIGMGFFTDGSTCYNCNTGCTGVRDAAAFSLDGPAGNVIASPATITDNNGVNADRAGCPYFTPENFAYQGPMGYEGHLESYIASSANWDLAQALVAKFGTDAGWEWMDKIWYGSLYPSKSAYQVASGGQCNVNAEVNGCGANNWYTVYLAADDDDGNLSNGTPNACRIWDAFEAHGIACGARPTCSPLTPDFHITSVDAQLQMCAGSSIATQLDIGAEFGFSNPVTLTTGSLPSGLTATFASNPVTPDNSTSMTLAGTAAAGDYTVTALGSATGSSGHSLDFALKVFAGNPAVPTLLYPADGATVPSTLVTLSWNTVADAASYRVEVASDAAFTNVVASAAGLTDTSYQPAGLGPNTTYYWRVTADNVCGGTPSVAASFATANMICSNPEASIPDGDSNGISDVIHLENPGQLDGLQVAIKTSHGWVGDLKFTLSHAGTDVVLINQPGVDTNSQYGCSSDNVDVLLDDSAATSVQDQCSTSSPAIGGVQRPYQLLAGLTGLTASGDWTLTAVDEESFMAGTLDQWCLIPAVTSTAYSVGGTLNGLNGSVTLQLNGADDLVLSADGSFNFSQDVYDTSSYAVSVRTQPASQICTVSNGEGTVTGAPVTDVSVDCSDNPADTYFVGGAVSGLANGQSVTLQLNGANDLSIANNGGFNFAQGLADSATYAVSTSVQPNSQVCTVSQGNGTIAGANVVDVNVTCGDPPPPEWSIGGHVTGLAGSGLVLRLNGSDDLAVSGNGSFSFTPTITDGGAWTASILTQPTGQTCVIGNASGTATADVANVHVQCPIGPVTDRIFANGFDTDSGPFVQPLLDPGFEATTEAFGSNPYWTGSDSHQADSTPFCDGSCAQSGSIPVHEGDWSAWMGAWDASTPSQMEFSQSVTIASGGPRYLRYWRLLARAAAGVTTLTISVDSTVIYSGDMTVLVADSEFNQRSLDVSAWADDGAHTITFTYDNDGSGSTDGSLFIDMVTIGDQPLMPAAAGPVQASKNTTNRGAVRRR